MKRLIPTLLLLPALSLADLSAKRERADPWGRPVVALTVEGNNGREPHSLLFALYSSGRVLFRTAPDSYSWAALTVLEVKALVEGLPLDRVGTFHPHQLQGDDGATECIQTWRDGWKHDCLDYGGIEYAQPAAPAGMVEIWKRLAHFSPPRASKWLPTAIDVRPRTPDFAPRCGALNPSAWPKEWPHSFAKGTVQEDWIFELPGSALEQLEDLARRRTAKGSCPEPVALDGKYYVLYYSFRLPHEDPWDRGAR